MRCAGIRSPRSLAPSVIPAMMAAALLPRPRPIGMSFCTRSSRPSNGRLHPANGSWAARAIRFLRFSGTSAAPSPSQAIVVFADSRASTVRCRSRASARTSKPGPRLADEAGTRTAAPFATASVASRGDVGGSPARRLRPRRRRAPERAYRGTRARGAGVDDGIQPIWADETARCLRDATLELERLVQGRDRVLHPLRVDDAGDTHFRGRDHLDVDPMVGQGPEHGRRHPRLSADAAADDRNLGEAVLREHGAGADLAGHALDAAIPLPPVPGP